jgi:hypothetical protein
MHARVSSDSAEENIWKLTGGWFLSPWHFEQKKVNNRKIASASAMCEMREIKRLKTSRRGNLLTCMFFPDEDKNKYG